MQEKFAWANDAAEIGNKLIEDHHRHLLDEKIAYVFKNADMKSRGQIIATAEEVVSAKNKFLTEQDFLIIISKPVWDTAKDAKTKQAIIDHALTHCQVETLESGDKRRRIVPHDVQEFASIITRWGLWTEGLKKMDKARQAHGQVILFPDQQSAQQAAAEQAAEQNAAPVEFPAVVEG